MNRHTGMVLIDIEKAFDSIWHQGLLFKLIKLDFPEYFKCVIGLYLLDREAYEQFDNVKSQ